MKGLRIPVSERSDVGQKSWRRFHLDREGGRKAFRTQRSPKSINQNLNYYDTLNEDNIFAFEAQHLIRDEDPFYNALLNNDPTNNGDDDGVVGNGVGNGRCAKHRQAHQLRM